MKLLKLLKLTESYETSEIIILLYVQMKLTEGYETSEIKVVWKPNDRRFIA